MCVCARASLHIFTFLARPAIYNQGNWRDPNKLTSFISISVIQCDKTENTPKQHFLSCESPLITDSQGNCREPHYLKNGISKIPARSMLITR